MFGRANLQYLFKIKIFFYFDLKPCDHHTAVENDISQGKAEKHFLRSINTI